MTAAVAAIPPSYGHTETTPMSNSTGDAAAGRRPIAVTVQEKDGLLTARCTISWQYGVELTLPDLIRLADASRLAVREMQRRTGPVGVMGPVPGLDGEPQG